MTAPTAPTRLLAATAATMGHAAVCAATQPGWLAIVALVRIPAKALTRKRPVAAARVVQPSAAANARSLITSTQTTNGSPIPSPYGGSQRSPANGPSLAEPSPWRMMSR